MGGVVTGFGHLWDRIFGRVTGTQLGSYRAAPPAVPQPPTQDTAANSQMQQDDLMRRRRGVYGNIFAGQSAATPTTAAKTQLGN